MKLTRRVPTIGTAGILLAAIGLLGAALLLSGCSGGRSAQETQKVAGQVHSFPVTLTDDAKRTVTISARPERIVSLAPANTEIAAALGLEDKLVGVTTYDDYPPSVKDIAKVGDFMNPNLEAIAAAKPDLILATTGVQADVLAKLEALGATVLAIDPQTVDGVIDDIEKVGLATGQKAEADAVTGKLRSDIAAIEAAAQGKEPVKVFMEIGQNPLFAVGSATLLDDLITRAGGRNVVRSPGYVPYSNEQLLKDDPTVYLATKGSMSNPDDLKNGPLANLGAVQRGRVYVLDENLVTRPGPRIAEGLKQVSEALFGQGQ